MLEPAYDAQVARVLDALYAELPLATAHQLAADEAETLSATTANSLVYGEIDLAAFVVILREACLLYTSPSPRDGLLSRMPSSA